MTTPETSPDSLLIRPVRDDDHPWIVRLLEKHWGDARIVTRGRVHEADRLPGFVAEVEGRRVGLVTFRVDADQCEVVSLNSDRREIGAGTRLLDRARAAAAAANCRRLWLVTTNDNLPALRFYQKRGWRITAVHAGAIEESRRLKPSIPPIGDNGIPIRDEIELELPLG